MATADSNSRFMLNSSAVASVCPARSARASRANLERNRRKVAHGEFNLRGFNDFIEAQKAFRKIQGVKDLWILKTALGRLTAKLTLTSPRWPRNVSPTAAGATPLGHRQRCEARVETVRTRPQSGDGPCGDHRGDRAK